jgi:hypothetical protein
VQEPLFTLADAHAAHRAMIEAEHQAREREEKMPSSAKTIAGHAAELRILRDKILDLLPEQQRRNYR